MTKNEQLRTLYEMADKFNIKLYPFQTKRIDTTNEAHLMSCNSMKLLKKEDMKRYIEALYYVHNENAGGYDGWSDALDTFESLGAEKREVRQGHRSFISLSF